MRFLCVLALSLALIIGITPAPQIGSADELLLVRILPAEVPQGRTALLRVAAPPEVTRVETAFSNRQFPLYRSIDGDWVGLLATDIYADRGTFPVEIYSWTDDTLFSAQTESVSVVWGGFLNQSIHVANNLVPLLDPSLNLREFETLQRVYSRYTPEKLWQGPFQTPVPGVQISEFGGIRDYNDGLLAGRHTGIDFRAGLGEPVHAAAHGRVVFAQHTPIHGNHVVIDHGIGVLTGYSHMGEIFVVPGQRILQGDTLGSVGATGRVEGAHFHFELTVNGFWVDLVQFMGLSIPEATN
jgi:murein DD-endopeptidase MepM/ murein hydrolase activator NlpD